MIAILFDRLGPYHYARLRAARFRGELMTVELNPMDETYAWEKVETSDEFQRLTLFCNGNANTKSAAKIQDRMSEVLDSIRPRVVVIPGWFSIGTLPALAWCLKTRTPSIIMSDSTADDELRVKWKESIKKRIVRLYSSALVAGKSHVDYLLMLGMPREQIFTGYDVVDNAYFFENADAVRLNAEVVRAHFGLPKKYFLASSRFTSKKNLSRLIQAYAQYRTQAGKDAWKLVLVGDGELRFQLVKLIEELRLKEEVLLPGFKQYSELPAYYGLASAFIHASTIDQWGLVVNEAMAAGLPVIVSERCGCASDLIENNRNGFTFNPYDVGALAGFMFRVASGNSDTEVMGQASREIINRWTLETFAEGLWNAVRAALNVHPPTASLIDRTLLWGLMRR